MNRIRARVLTADNFNTCCNIVNLSVQTCETEINISGRRIQHLHVSDETEVSLANTLIQMRRTCDHPRGSAHPRGYDAQQLWVLS